MNPDFLRQKAEVTLLMSLPFLIERRLCQLLDTFGAPRNVIEAIRSLRDIPGVDESLLATWKAILNEQRPKDYLKFLEETGIGVLLEGEEGYPSLLGNIAFPPLGLFYKGKPPSCDAPAVAIVGSRKATSYGTLVSEKIATCLACEGINVVSGLAYGIDSAAHRGALGAGGFTTAVLGCGLDIVYPPGNRKLFSLIEKSGCIFSEYPLGGKPEKFHFPQRNRIIAGMSSVVVVVEASSSSGALITADIALGEGRDVMAVPGSIFSPNSRGTNSLIRSGALPVTEVEDVLEVLGVASKDHRDSRAISSHALSVSEGKIMEALSGDFLDPEEISARCSLDSQEVMSDLARLELEGFVRRGLDGKYHA